MSSSTVTNGLRKNPSILLIITVICFFLTLTSSSAQVGDFIWFDANMNGLQDAVEPGVPGVTVYLLDENMNRIIDPVTTNPIREVTDADGFYSFEGITTDSDSDTFFLEFALSDFPGAIPTPIQDSVINVGGAVDSEFDSDLSLIPFGDGFKTDTIILLTGDNIPTIDAGIIGQDTIGDLVFEDVNGNGIQDHLDQVIPNVKVYLIVNGTIADSTLTDVGGNYYFPGLLSGPDFTYKIMFDMPLGFAPTLYNDPFMIGDEGSDSDADTANMLMTEMYNFTDTAFSYLDLDAGFFVPVSVGDTVWIDENGNGIQDGEEPLVEATVTLYRVNPATLEGEEVLFDAFGNPVTPFTTGADGSYIFENLSPGEYYVEFDLTGVLDGPQYVPTVFNAGIDTSIDSDVMTDPIDMVLRSDTTDFLLSSEVDYALDAGLFIPVNVGDTVFVDENGNGLQDVGEMGIQDVGVALYKVESGVGVLQTVDFLGNPIDMVTTNMDGYYKFENLQPGQYYVVFDPSNLTAEYFPTYDNINGFSNEANDSDIAENGNLASDTTALLSSGEMDCTLDAGFFEVVSIGDFAFIDADLNGLQDPTDPGLAGILVTCYYYHPDSLDYIQVTENVNGNPVTPVTTGPDGSYVFDSLPPGLYYVNFDSGGIPQTLEDVNGNANDDEDSDINEFGDSDILLVTSGMTNNSFDAGYEVLDYGDLPESYVTTDADNAGEAPKHVVRDYKYLGAKVDQDVDGVPSSDGLGDDNTGSSYTVPVGQIGGDDEDGVEFLSPLIPGSLAYLKLTYTAPESPAPDDAFLNAWIDFDGDGTFTVGDAVNFTEIDAAPIAATTNLGLPAAGTEAVVILTFEVPETAIFANGQAFSRFRYSCAGSLSPNSGLASDGEIEDYVVPLTKVGNLVWLDQNYDGIQDTSTINKEEGIADAAVSLTYTYVDEVNGIDLSIQVDTVTDENGKYNFCGLLPTDIGAYKITVVSPEFMTPTVANNPFVSDSLDSDHAVNMGDSIVMTDIFQITSSSGLPLMEDGIADDPNSLGTFPDSLFNQTYDFGFVPLDYGDLDSTFTTASEDGGPVHVISEKIFLGQGADAERNAAVDSIAGALADGDDNAPGYVVPAGSMLDDDEDGIQFITPLIPGYKATISVNYTLTEEDGFLNGWIDFNGNGMLDPIEALGFYTDGGTPDTDGALSSAIDTTIELCFNVPNDALYNEGDVHARFRISNEGGLLPTGGFPTPVINGPQAPQGEVEDYFVPLAKIGNLAFFDNDLDGTQDGAVGVNPETGVAGVNQILTFAGPDGAPFDSTDFTYAFSTDANGNYYICGLIEGEYNIVPTKYDTSSVTPEDTIPTRYVLTVANCNEDDDLDSDFMPNLRFNIPDLLTNDLPVNEDGFTDAPGSQGFPDAQDQINFDQGWIPEPNIEAIANIAGVDYPASGQCRNFNVIADVCIQNTGFVEMNGELIGARLKNIDIEIDLGAQFMGAFVGVIGDPIILDTVEYEEAFMLTDDEDRPNENPNFDGNEDIDGSLMDGILEPNEIVCLRITFEISPDELPEVDAMNLQFNAVVSGMAINNEGKPIPDYFNGDAQYMAVDSSDRMFMFDGTFDDPDEPEPLTNCYETTRDLSQESAINVSYDENCSALITPQMVLTRMDENCDTADYPLGGYYRLQLEDLNGNILIPYTDSLFLDDPAYIGNMYNISTQSVADLCNSTWGKVTVENKFPPIIQCANDTITCGELLVLPPPTVLNNCGEINLTLLDRTTMDVACEDPNLQLVITETWIAIDPNGLRSDTCTQTLSVEKFDINDIEGPSVTDTLLNCSAGTMASPEDLGVPSLNGVPLYPDQFAECGIFVDYKDEFFSFGNDCSSGVQRTWTVQNWICGTDNSVTFVQLITFIDTTGPVLTNIPPDMTVSTSGFACDASVDVPAISVKDDCNPTDIRVDINYEGGFQMNSNGGTISLSVGTSTVTYIAYDVCGNTSTASFNVTVQDLEQPITICDAFTTVSLNSEGMASLSASKLDNGSMDECGPVELAIRRMDDDLGFMEAVDFTCADIGSENIMVALRVTDLSGNSNVCMAQVELQDKLAPVLVRGLPDITISCTFPFDMNNLSVFGTVVNDADSIRPIVIDDEEVQFSGPAQDGLILDNCSTAAMSEITSGGLDQCGKGTLFRTIIATSPNGEQISLTQRITLVNPTPFLESEITWPADITLNQCTDGGLDPVNFPEGQGFPLYEEDICDMVSSTYEDRISSNTPDGGGCLVIERTWFVSDWCQRINGQFAIFEEEQLITINNDVAPEITSGCGDLRVESLDGGCSDVFVTLTASATDDCVMSDNLIWTYEIDLFSDGSIDTTGAGNDASGSYPVGTHEIRFLVGDGCGNISECVYSFELVNVKAATPLCFQGLSAGLTPMDTIGDSAPDAELLMLTPDFVDAGSAHPCRYDLQLSFSADVNDTLRVFGCEDLGQQALQLWVTDPNGNQDFCSTFIIVEDNNEVDLCPENNDMVTVGGRLYTEEQVDISDVEVYIMDTDVRSVSDASGQYMFEEMPKGADYSVGPLLDIDHSNGVTTLDLIMIQKHILGLSPITSPYKLLAADINKNGQITGTDLLELRKLILGLYDSFPHNTSWRFVDAGYRFVDPANPWGQTIPEQYEIYNLSRAMDIDFYGLKVGDINGSVKMNGKALTAEVRKIADPFKLVFDDKRVAKGETVLLPFYGERINSILGYQFTMEVDQRKAEIEEVESLCGALAELNFGDRYLAEGYLTSSWSNVDNKQIKAGSALFGIKITAKEDMKLSDVISLTGDITKTEAYTKEGELIELLLGLRGKVIENKGVTALYQNQPNPWIKNTVISFSLPEATEATLRIYDVTGKLVKVHRSAYEAGVHEYELLEQDFSSRGVYYYELITKDYQMSKKMVLIK